MDYPIYAGSGQLGKVQVLEEGLYLKVSCRCQRPGEMIYRLVADLGDRRESLGILAPTGDGWGLDRKIPAKRLRGESLSFSLVPSHEPVGARFVPLSPEEPFAYVGKLKDAYLAVRDGKPGLMIPE